MKKKIHHISAGLRAHKVAFSAIAVTAIVGGFGMYNSAKTADAAPSYTVASASIGNIVQTVTGTGQISAENQIDVASKVSGTITSIDAAVGQKVHAGDLIATIDSTDALRSLKTAELSLAQLTEPAKPGDLTNAVNAVNKAYSDGFNSVASAMVDMQTVIPGLNDMFYGLGGFLGTVNSGALNPTALSYRNTASLDFDKANAEYQSVLKEYNSLNRQSATSSIDQLIGDSYDLAQKVSGALQDVQNTLTFIANNQTNYLPKSLPTAQASATAWTTTVNGDLAALSGAENTIGSSANAYNNLVTGADPLSVQSSQLSVEQARENYSDYFIRAPFDGTVGRIPVSVYGQAGNGTVMATVISNTKVADISLNEVDAAKVKVGEPVALTFDAIDGLNATGTVAEVDLVGTVSQGVVSYNVKISVNTDDPRILPGMSVNATITAAEKDGVLIVPSAAVKTQGNRSYVLVMASSTVADFIRSQLQAAGVSRSGNKISGNGGIGTSTASGGSGGNRPSGGGSFGRQLTVTLTSSDVPTEMTVTTGMSDDTNTEIVSGLSPREWVVTKTSAASSASSATAPSILNTLGGNRGGAGAGRAVFRAGGGG